jgi:hypothetical protein
MAFAKRFQETSNSYKIKVRYLEMDRQYPITRANPVDTSFGTTVLLSIRRSAAGIKKVFCLDAIAPSGEFMIFWPLIQEQAD